MHQSLLKRYMCLFMAILLLISSTGFVMVEHICQMRGKSQSVWVGKEKCKKHCSRPTRITVTPREDGTSHLKKQACCRETTYLTRVHVQSTSGTGEVVTVPATPATLFQEVVYLVVDSRVSPEANIGKVNPTPRPCWYLAGEYLPLLCTWII